LEKVFRSKGVDLEALEGAIRSAVLAAGARVLESLLYEIGRGRRQGGVTCECGCRMESRGVKPKEVLTILGPVVWSRSMFRCPSCKKTRYPGDEELDISGTSRSPGLRRMMARAGSRGPFKEGSEDLLVYAGVKVSAKDVERVAEKIGEDMERWSGRERERVVDHCSLDAPEESIPIMYVSYDGTGVPMTRSEVAGRRGKQPDGSARTREVKLGCVFTQSATGSEGFAMRDPESTSFVGAIESSDEFGWRMYGEALRRGLNRADKVVVIGDGARWIKTVADTHFPDAVVIIDLYHAREHVAGLCKLLFCADGKNEKLHRERWWTYLDEGNVEIIIGQARKTLGASRKNRKEVLQEIGYLEKNKEKMRYAKLRAEGLFVGSGVVEAGCKSIIGQRLKQSGMEWTVRGANSIIALRCMIKSDRMEDYWENRAA